jgi:uncharacterized membrane protein YkvA (DUF1232 family)
MRVTIPKTAAYGDSMSAKRALDSWKRRARQLRADTYALYLAYRDPRVPWYAKALAILLAAYALSPIDLIPDFIPVLGYLDDLILVPLGVILVVRMMPETVWEECRAEAAKWPSQDRPRSWAAAAVVVTLWLLLLAFLVVLVMRLVSR